jgi:hypothetical protein
MITVKQKGAKKKGIQGVTPLPYTLMLIYKRSISMVREKFFFLYLREV